MFEVGKRYKKISGWNSGCDYILTKIKEDGYANWRLARNGAIAYYLLSMFDPTPIDDTPAPRMVTTCDIGARVVRGRDWEWGGQDGGIGNTGVITKSAGNGWCFVLWDGQPEELAYSHGEDGYDLYYADEQPKKEATPNQELPGVGICKDCGREVYGIHFCVPKGIAAAFKKASEAMVDLAKSVEAKTKDDKTPPDPAPGIASVMFGSKPRLMYGSFEQIKGPTKDEEARNARTEEERKRYER